MRPMVIKPEVGLPVTYWPPGSNSTSPKFAALIADVHGERTVSLAVFDSSGKPWDSLPIKVHLKQPDDQLVPAGVAWCEWPWRFVATEKVRMSEEAMRM